MRLPIIPFLARPRQSILLLFLLAATLRAEDVVVAHLDWESGPLGGARARKITLSAEPPDGITPPKGMGEAAYGTFARGDGKKVALALDFDASSPRLWIDSDLDGDLSDETPTRVRPHGQAWRHEPTIRLPVKGESRFVPVVFRFYRSATCARDHVHLMTQVHRRGTVVLGGRVRLVAITDGNSDLRFDDPKNDRLLLDLDGDRKVDLTHERVVPGKPFRLRGESFVATVPLASGKAVEFRPAREAPAPAPRAWTPLNPSTAFHHGSPRETFAQLKARFPSSKTATLPLIAGLFTKQSCDFLARLAHKSSGEVYSLRSQAVRALGHESYRPWAASVLALARNESDQSIAGHALLALHPMGYPQRAALYRDRLLRSSKPVVVRSAATGLVLLGEVDVVVSAAQTLGSASLRSQAYQGLRYSRSGPPPAVLRLLARQPGAVRGYALEDMLKLGMPEARAEALLAARVDPLSPHVGRVVAMALGRAGDVESVKTLLSIVGKANALVKKTVREELGPVRDPLAVAEFVAALAAPDPVVRALAAELLAAFPRRKITDALLRRAKKEKDASVLEAVLDAIGEHRDPRGVRLLLSIARKRDPALRGAAMRALARLGPGLPKVRAFFLKLLDATRWEDRVYALDAAGAAADKRVVPKVLSNLKHKVWQVRHAAAHALGLIRIRAAIEPLIVLLEKEDMKRVRAEAAAALFRITGQHLYDFADTWRRWWVEHSRTFRIPEEAPHKKKRRPGGSVASFYGLPLDSGRVIFVVDESGSMSAADRDGKNRLEMAVSEVLGAIGRLRSRDRVNLIFFETRIHVWKKKLTRLTPGVRTDVERYLKARKPTGGTNLYDGLETALLDKEVDTVFLLSDGAPGSGKYTLPADILRAVRRRNQVRRIAIHCVSVGTESQLLEDLAAQNGGRYVRR